MLRLQLRVNFLFAKTLVQLSFTAKRDNKYGLAIVTKKLFLLVFSKLTLKKTFATHKMHH